MEKNDAKRSPEGTLTPSGSYLELNTALVTGNYDPYRELVWDEVNPKEVTKPPSTLARLKYTLFPKFSD